MPFFEFFSEFLRSTSCQTGVFWGILCSKANFMADFYYILRQNGAVPQGPFSRETLKEMAACGELPAEASCLHPEQGCWLPVADVLNPPACPPAYMAWSYITAVCCFPFSLISVRRSSQVKPLYEQGKYAEARAASRSALRWNLFFLVLIIVLLIYCYYIFSYWYAIYKS